MSTLRTLDLRCYFGFDCAALPPGAHALEQTLEFERAARTEFGRRFELWAPDRSFAAPYTAPLRPSIVVQTDPHGDLDAVQIEAFAREHLRAHSRGTSTVDLGAASTALCYYDVVQGVWVIIHGVQVQLDGQQWTADRIVDDFEADYRSARPQLPAGFDADCAVLRSLPVGFFVALPR